MGQAQPKNKTKSQTEEAIRQYLTSHTSVLGRMMSAHFQIQTMEEAEKLATMLAGQCPDPQRVSTGIWELISNAIEHGNLEIDYQEKSDLIHSGAYADELARRLSQKPYSSRIADVQFQRNKTNIRIRVCDEGPGFDYEKFFIDDRPLIAPNGRGILIARKFSFDRLVYRGSGNIVDAIIRI